MTRNFKALGLALVAAFAMSAVLAAGASAQFHSESETTTLSVSSNQVQKFQIKSGGSTVECSKLTLDNSTQTKKTTTEVKVEPTYTSCEEIVGLETTIDTNGCDYVFHLPDSSTTGTTDVECPSGTGIQITLENSCWYEVDTQTGLGSVEYKNVGTSSTREVEIIPNVTKIVSSRTTSDLPFSLCPQSGTEGTYKGNSVVTGLSSSNHTGLFVD